MYVYTNTRYTLCCVYPTTKTYFYITYMGVIELGDDFINKTIDCTRYLYEYV